ncbi:hypothetical protein H7H78_12105 [Mycobacterium shinjukuense]|uniref:Uncharacterized protein n=1 Tax=Mycobacterium shinjukuense TaxID=398694 RepID=A0A7I7MSY8_9MYCO|nr:hypothetical protein [Mycobacterium shinjukuense]MCV6986149.1 hypothetical protein [Mycobacterium shinjukuense]ORB72324.1 hypothetical protein BST45_00590 [Mycobacterium shinjukuense]BBX75361.1 hypothetical protein MSHI_32670 [Mycobacterium shinjukuense]
MGAGRREGEQIFVDELAQFAGRVADRRVRELAERAAEPLRVAVHGRPGTGCSTVARALNAAGTSSGITVTPPGCAADVEVYVTVEVIKPEDRDAVAAIAGQAGHPVVVVLNKADLAGFAGTGPMAAAHARCARFAALLGVPVEPMIGLLAVAALDDVDGCLGKDSWAGLRALAAHPGASGCLDGSFDGFLTAQLPVPTTVRLRLLDTLDLFGIALGVAAVCRGGTAEQLRALLRRVSGVDAVVDKVVAAGAEVRYRRVLEAVAELEALAVADRRLGDQIGEFLASDDTVLARMAAAVDMARLAGLQPEPDTVSDEPVVHLERARRWQRHNLENGGSGPVSDVRRACGADITRGSLRLWARAGGAGRSQSGERR